jgi:HSP20 family protein
MMRSRTDWMASLSSLGAMTFPTKWCPAADVYRARDGWLIKVELAGVARQDVQVSVERNLLVIRGRRRDTLLSEGEEQFLLEILYSEFERRIELPVDLSRAGLSAECRDGMLVVRVRTGDAE